MEEKANISDMIQSIGNTEDKLIQILIAIQAQSEDHYISEEQMDMVSKHLNIPLSKVYGTASFYHMLSAKKKGKYVIGICNSGPCYVNNSANITRTLEDLLQINVGETTQDGLFSLEYVSCFGACHIAPAIKINEEIYGNMTGKKVEKIIESLRKEAI